MKDVTRKTRWNHQNRCNHGNRWTRHFHATEHFVSNFRKESTGQEEENARWWDDAIKRRGSFRLAGSHQRKRCNNRPPVRTIGWLNAAGRRQTTRPQIVRLLRRVIRARSDQLIKCQPQRYANEAYLGPYLGKYGSLTKSHQSPKSQMMLNWWCQSVQLKIISPGLIRKNNLARRPTDRLICLSIIILL